VLRWWALLLRGRRCRETEDSNADGLLMVGTLLAKGDGDGKAMTVCEGKENRQRQERSLGERWPDAQLVIGTRDACFR